MSRSLVTSPLAPFLTMISPNSCSVCSRPCALMESCRSSPTSLGDDPTTPAAAWTFWARISHHVGGRQPTLCNLLRIDPDPHRIVAGAEQLHLADALDARQPILDVEDGIVAQVG